MTKRTERMSIGTEEVKQGFQHGVPGVPKTHAVSKGLNASRDSSYPTPGINKGAAAPLMPEPPTFIKGGSPAE